MKKVFKVTLDLTPNQTIKAPSGAKILHVEAQHEHPTIWFECEPDNPNEPTDIELVPTGGIVPEGYDYLGTCLLSRGNLVLHVYKH